MFKVTCHACGSTIHESEELQPLESILESLNYECPKCKRKINPTYKKILLNGNPLKFGNEPKPTVEPKEWWRKHK